MMKHVLKRLRNLPKVSKINTCCVNTGQVLGFKPRAVWLRALKHYVIYLPGS